MAIERSSESIKLEICKILNKIGALQFGAFKLASGKISPYYIDLRIVPSFPDVFHKICNFYVEFIKKEIDIKNYDRIAGIPVAGMPFASIIAYNLQKPFLYVRRGIRLRGRQRRIEGVLTPGENVLLVDDLVTTGLSLARAAKAITTEGGIVSDAVVLLDREEGGAERLRKTGIKLHALLTVREVANKLLDIGAIDEEQYKTILKQVKRA
ncbi:MAG: orotate phosphoribosyltransferase [Candidatus Bathyarchaeia archaeon]